MGCRVVRDTDASFFRAEMYYIITVISFYTFLAHWSQEFAAVATVFAGLWSACKVCFRAHAGSPLLCPDGKQYVLLQMGTSL